MSYESRYHHAWTDTVTIRDPLHLPLFAYPSSFICGLGLLACIGIAIWACVVHRRLRVLDWSFGTTIICAIFTFAFLIADDIIRMTRSEVQASFLLVEALFERASWFTSILLLVAIWRLFFGLLRRREVESASTDSPTSVIGGRRGIRWAHYAFAGFLGLIYVIWWVMQLAQVNNEILKTEPYKRYVDLALAIEGFLLLLCILYLIATMDVLVLSGALLYGCGRAPETSAKYTALLSFVLISIPLLFSAVMFLASTALAVYVQRQADIDKDTFTSLLNELYVLETTALSSRVGAIVWSLAGIVAIRTRLGKDLVGRRGGETKPLEGEPSQWENFQAQGYRV